MDQKPARKCQACRTLVLRDSMVFFTAPGLSLHVCTQCYLKLIQKYLGYAQTELQFPKQSSSSDEDLPF